MSLQLTTNWWPCLFLTTRVLLLPILGSMSSAVVGKERIVNGSTVNPPHKYPFMVAIWWDGCYVEGTDNPGVVDCIDKAKRVRCGGGVLNKHWIVTAGHCLFITSTDKGIYPEHLFVLTGLHDREQLEPWSQNLSIAEYVLHEGYQMNPYLINDIALIRVNGTILFGDKVTPVNLPSCDFDVKRDGEITGTTIGWGLNQTRPPQPRLLQELEVPVVTLETCQRVYGVFEILEGPPGNESRVNETTAVTDSMICAGGLDGAGTCGFDSGSPLVILDQATQTYTQVGIDSFGSGTCGRAGYHTVYTKISKYLNWINSQIQRCYSRIIKN